MGETETIKTLIGRGFMFGLGYIWYNDRWRKPATTRILKKPLKTFNTWKKWGFKDRFRGDMSD